MTHSVISLGLGLGGGKASTSSGRTGGGFANDYSVDFDQANDNATGSEDSADVEVYGISAWVRPDAEITQNYYPKQAEGVNCILGWGGSHWGLILGPASETSIISCRINDTNTTYQYKPASGTVTFPANTWMHIMTQWVDSSQTDSGNAGYDIWVNGSRVGNAVQSAPGTPVRGQLKTTGFTIGSRANDSYWFGGQIDEISVFDSAVSDADVATIYNVQPDGTGVPGDLEDLEPFHWWRMGDSDVRTGTTITDLGSAGRDLTLVNGPTFSSEVPS